MPAANDFRISEHTVRSLHARLVCAPKYRCEPLGVVLKEPSFEGDRVHLLVSYSPKVALSTLARRFKGTSALRARMLRFHEVARYLWGKHFWSESYCVVSCGGAPLEVITRYFRSKAESPPIPGNGASPPPTCVNAGALRRRIFETSVR